MNMIECEYQYYQYYNRAGENKLFWASGQNGDSTGEVSSVVRCTLLGSGSSPKASCYISAHWLWRLFGLFGLLYV